MTTKEKDMSNIDKMVNRFLGWKLPKDFCPDAGISFKPTKPYECDEFGDSWWPVGTNLLTANQARQMFDYVTADESAAGLHPHQQRVVTEKAELDEKICKLDTFINGESFGDLCAFAECCRMINQLHVMKQYSAILGERIAAFG